MADAITTDNFDDLLKRTYDRKFEEILDRIRDLEHLVKKDVTLDKQQKREQPESEDLIRDMYGKLDYLIKRVDSYEKPMEEMRTLLEELRGLVQELETH